MAFNSGSSSGKIPESGAIFMSNRVTKEECLRRKLVGLPLPFADFVKHIRVGMLLFLFEHESRLLYGVFEAVSDGTIDIVPHAFKSSGKKFPAQVRFELFWNCHPIPESSFREAIKKNYFSAYKFNFGLSREQVLSLLLLFDSQRVLPMTSEKAVSFDAKSVSPDIKEHEELEYADDQYIPLSLSNSSESEGSDAYEVEPRNVSKGLLYSDNSVKRTSVFSRLNLPTLEVRKYKPKTSDHEKSTIDDDPVPRLKRKRNDSIETKTTGHEASEEDGRYKEKKVSALARLSFPEYRSL